MYRLPETLRKELARPMAPVLTTEDAVRAVKGKLLVAVGDVCSERFLEAGVTPKVVVADWRTQRAGDLSRLRERATKDPAILWLKVTNPAGAITKDLWSAIVAALGADARALVEVDGEEDLAALPAMLLAPDGAVVAYGQPPIGGAREGVVLVTVTAETRRLARSFIDRMEVVPDGN